MSLRMSLVLSLALLPAAAFAESSRTSVDWAGMYHGKLPCADCEGIDTTITLNDDSSYSMTETYLGKPDGTFKEKGKFTWDKKGGVITLDEEDKRAYRVGEGNLVQLDASGKPAGDAYVLTQNAVHQAETASPSVPVVSTEGMEPSTPKFDAAQKEGAFIIGAGQNMRVIPNTLVASDMANGDKHIVFDAVMNFEHEMEGGHRSLFATFDINCTQNQYDMPEVAYFKGVDAKGEKLAGSTDNGDNWLDLPEDQGEDIDPLTQAAQAWCQ